MILFVVFMTFFLVFLSFFVTNFTFLLFFVTNFFFFHHFFPLFCPPFLPLLIPFRRRGEMLKLTRDEVVEAAHKHLVGKPGIVTVVGPESSAPRNKPDWIVRDI